MSIINKVNVVISKVIIYKPLAIFTSSLSIFSPYRPSHMPQHPSQFCYQPSQSKTMKTEYTQHSTQQPPIKKPSYDQQFHSIYQQITQHQYFTRITKHDKIRINKWLTKLSNISTNDLWKKNRNNYIKLIRLMFDCEVIIAPFLMMPPERDLHKLTTHEINVIIDQVDKIVEDREGKGGVVSTGNGGNNTIMGGSGSTGNGNINNNKFNKVAWMQESAYVNHQQHNNSLQKYNKQCETDSRKTYQTSSVTMNNISKLTELQSPINSIPPKYPTSKSPINSKITTNSKSPINNSKNLQSQLLKNSNSIKQTAQQSNNPSRQRSKQRPVQPQSLSPQNYFRKKQRLNTFQTQDQQQDDYLHDPYKERNSPIVYEKDHYDITHSHSDNFIDHQSRQAINILKCGFRLLQKLPIQSIQDSSLKEIQTFRKIINQNDFLKQDLEKESRLLELFSQRGTNRGALNQINSMNHTQKLNLKKKMKLTVVSQTHRNQGTKTAAN